MVICSDILCEPFKIATNVLVFSLSLSAASGSRASAQWKRREKGGGREKLLPERRGRKKQGKWRLKKKKTSKEEATLWPRVLLLQQETYLYYVLKTNKQGAAGWNKLSLTLYILSHCLSSLCTIGYSSQRGCRRETFKLACFVNRVLRKI